MLILSPAASDGACSSESQDLLWTLSEVLGTLVLVTRPLPLEADAISRAEAATVLGVGEESVARLRREGLLTEVRGDRRM